MLEMSGCVLFLTTDLSFGGAGYFLHRVFAALSPRKDGRACQGGAGFSLLLRFGFSPGFMSKVSEETRASQTCCVGGRVGRGGGVVYRSV